MSLHDKTNVHSDLAKERQGASFDPENITVLLDGGDWLTTLRREMEKLALEDKELTDAPDYHYLSRAEKYTEGVRKASLLIHKIKKNSGLDGRANSYFYGNLVFPNETSPLSLHSAMFVPTIESQSTPEQKELWLPKASSYEIIGTYAQTELGHGTNVRALETTATYDPKTQEFVIHSPTLTSSKWWPGGLGKTSNYAVVVANLFTGGRCHGTHSFMVQLRDLATHQPMPGITLGDIGPKIGFDSIDNGFLRFNNVRIPRENMLMKLAQVLPDGTYVKTAKSDKLGYGTMVFIRAMVVLDQAARGLAQASTIAIRYSCIRRQSELKPGGPEPQVLDYQTQQYKLFPFLAAAYAYWFAGLKMRETYFLLNYEIQLGNTELLPELHATSSGIKAWTSDGAMYGIEQCRLACGGHGYSLSSGLPKIYSQTTAACTYEGENTVLYLQTARYLVKAYSQSTQQSASATSNSTAYLREKHSSRSAIGSSASITPETLIVDFKHRAARLVGKACNRLKKLEAGGCPSYDAWNLSSVDLVKASKAHCEVYLLEAFLERVLTADDASSKHVLIQLLKLYGVYRLSIDAADFIEDGYMTSTQLNTVNDVLLELLAAVRPNAVALVDSFDFTDRLLGSVLGRYDGQVYDNLYQWALNSPLNTTQVHESHKYLQSLSSKL